MLGNIPGKEKRLYTPDYVVYDLETTGISCQRDEVIEISAIRVREGHPVATFTQLVNPGRSIPYGASRVNNIYDNMVADKPGFQQVLGEFLNFIGNDVLVGHNIKNFDMKFIYRDCQRYFGQTIDNDYIDTLYLAKRCFPSWKHRRLENLAEHYGISTQGAHRALQDCHMNQQVFELMAQDIAKAASSGGAVHQLENLNFGQAGERQGASLQQGKTRYCPRCHSTLKKRNGRFGYFWGCSGFPNCRYTENA